MDKHLYGLARKAVANGEAYITTSFLSCEDLNLLQKNNISHEKLGDEYMIDVVKLNAMFCH